MYLTKHLFTILFAATLLSPLPASAEEHKKEESELSEEQKDKLSETLGNFIGRNLKAPGFTFNLDSLIKGIREGAEGNPAPLSEKEYQEMISQLQKNSFKKLSKDNLEAANAFMEKNKDAEGIISLEPGKLQYTIIEEGSGDAVQADGTPLIHYSGTYLNGTSFGSSKEMGEPISLPLDQAISGFREGIAGMKEGEVRKLFIHPEMGYGEEGPQIEPNALLIFEVEVVKANADEEDDDLDIDDEDEDDDEEYEPVVPITSGDQEEEVIK